MGNVKNKDKHSFGGKNDAQTTLDFVPDFVPRLEFAFRKNFVGVFRLHDVARNTFCWLAHVRGDAGRLRV